jgi:acyl-CoA dehydrogenase
VRVSTSARPHATPLELRELNLALSPRGEEIRAAVAEFLDARVMPVERELSTSMDALEGPEPFSTLMAVLRCEARAAGLWNLFLPHEDEGAGLTIVDYGHVCELLGRTPWAPMVFNCSFPDTGNMEILLEHSAGRQRTEWAEPLLTGEIRTCFAMTEPDVAGSDPTGIATTAILEGSEWVISGRKWFISFAIGSALCLTIAKTDPDAEPHRRLSLIGVPMGTPGLEVVRRVPIFGHAAGPGHCELVFDGCRVPADHLIAERGMGFALAQARLGPGRIHHCMRALGMAERALELAAERALTRPLKDGVLADTQLVRDFLAISRIELDAARLLVLRAARTMDLHGKDRAYRDISIAKVYTAQHAQAIIDRAMQIHGALGISDDTILPELFVNVRGLLRIGDGPDEIHKLTVAKQELRRWDPAAR